MAAGKLKEIVADIFKWQMGKIKNYLNGKCDGKYKLIISTKACLSEKFELTI